MSERGGRLSQAALVLCLAPVAFQATLSLVREAGIVGGRPEEELSLAQRQQVVEAQRLITEAVIENRRLLADLHSGSAPRDMNLVPHWSAMRTSIDSLVASMQQLRRSIDKNTDTARDLGYQMRGDEPPTTRAQKEGTSEQSWFDRMRAWVRGVAEG